MKSQRGVTMMELVIVLIVIILIITFSVYTSKESVDKASITELYNEMLSIRDAITAVNVKSDMDESFTITKEREYDLKVNEIASTVAEFENAYGIDINDIEFDDLYILFGMDDVGMSDGKYENSKVRDTYGFDSIKHSYIVNFNETKVDLLKSVRLGNNNVRTFEQVRALAEE